MKKFISLFIFSSLFLNALAQICDDFGKEKGLYVDGFFYPHPLSEARADFNEGILGNRPEENALLWYAKENKFNYLVLTGTSSVFRYGTIYDGYHPKLKDFVSRAKAMGIDIGLTFGTDFNNPDWERDVSFLRVPITREAIFNLLDDDMINTAWDVISEIMDRTPNAELTINHDIYALISISKFNKDFERQAGSGAFDGLGIKTLVTEYEWWNGEGNSDTAKYRNATTVRYPAFITLLQAMDAFKKDTTNHITRIDAYQAAFSLYK